MNNDGLAVPCKKKKLKLKKSQNCNFLKGTECICMDENILNPPVGRVIMWVIEA